MMLHTSNISAYSYNVQATEGTYLSSIRNCVIKIMSYGRTIKLIFSLSGFQTNKVYN